MSTFISQVEIFACPQKLNFAFSFLMYSRACSCFEENVSNLVDFRLVIQFDHVGNFRRRVGGRSGRHGVGALGHRVRCSTRLIHHVRLAAISHLARPERLRDAVELLLAIAWSNGQVPQQWWERLNLGEVSCLLKNEMRREMDANSLVPAFRSLAALLHPWQWFFQSSSGHC